MLRGKIKHYTKKTEQRLTQKLWEFIGRNQDKRAYWVTLTTTETDPAKTKRMLKRWVAQVTHQHTFQGLYVLEFCKLGYVHYHLVLTHSFESEALSMDRVRFVLWNAWERQGNHKSVAFDISYADLKKPEWLVSYMPKADIEPGVPHPDRWQKRLPASLIERGLGTKWWGVFGQFRLTNIVPSEDAA